MIQRHFRFGRQAVDNAVLVHPSDLFQQKKNYGFVVEENRRSENALKLPELNAAFDTMYWYQDSVFSRIEETEYSCFLDSVALIEQLAKKEGGRYPGEERRIPLIFKCCVPKQGNYQIKLTITPTKNMKDVLIFTGRRNLRFRGDIPAGKKFELTCIVNICDIVPRGKEQVYQHRSVDIAIVAERPEISGLSVVSISCPTIYIAGDSTVTDQSAEYPYAPGTSYCGWGQMFPAYLSGNYGVSNHAHSGLTTDSFRKEGHYSIMEQYAQPGDFYFFQFGHNDQKLAELKAKGGYRANLLNYITDCRNRHGYPVLVTPVARNSWKGNDGTYNDLLEEYAEVCVEAGKATGTPVADLHKLSREFILEHGLEESKRCFFPKDFTHTNDYGAYKMAGFLVEELKRELKESTESAYHQLAEALTEGFGVWMPAEEIILPEKPKVYAGIENPTPPGELLAEVDRLEAAADRVAVLDMLIKTARFFPTNVYNDMFTDVVGHEWYAGTVECAYQNGLIDQNLVVNGYFEPLSPVTMEEFLVFAMNGCKSRKNLPKEQPCPLDGQCREFARPYVRAAYALGLISEEDGAVLKTGITRGWAVNFCRAMKL
ncbi:MAG: rhamnogalacturonan acetylesterase [Lachnospiraceae bacterium]|nr:rhamnogalacturonan acetylesterase [Lachnospiraceae bacterium]